MSVKICLVGEAWGEIEAEAKHAFVGPSGYALMQMLDESGLMPLTSHDHTNLKNAWTVGPTLMGHFRRAVWEAHPEVKVLNVFDFRPENNDIETLTTSKTGDHLGLPAIRTGKYVRSEYAGELERLWTQLAAAHPNIVVALGGTAAWALLHNSRIMRIRGTVGLAIQGGHKVIATYHPAAILRQHELRAITILDLEKAKRESSTREIRRTVRQAYIDPTLEDLEWFWERHIVGARRLYPDIETAGSVISCIGFATDTKTAMVVPFIDPRKPNGSYWPTLEAELAAWAWVRRVLGTNIPKVLQNASFDLHFLWRGMGIQTNGFIDDSMLAHHALYPESPKGLGFLGSIYAQESAWKEIPKKTVKTIKRDN